MKIMEFFSAIFSLKSLSEKAINLSDSEILADLNYCGPAHSHNGFGSLHHSTNTDLKTCSHDDINAIIVDVESGVSDRYHYSPSEPVSQVSDYMQI